MQQIKYGRTLASAQVRFKQRYTALMQTAVSSIGGVLLRYERDGIIPVEFADDVARQAGEIVQAVFVVDGRTSIRANGVPVSPYARALMTEIVLVTIEVVNKHADFMRRYLPDDVAWMLQQPARTIAELAHLRVGYPTTDHFQIYEADDKRLTDEELERLRLFAPNPLAEYEPPHTWVDPNGYVLSQRIWNNSQETRRKLDAFLYDQIREGRGAREIARNAEQFLLPGRARIRTRKPYGSDASYDAMRLARTEISHAHNNAAWVSATLNPYVSQIRMMRSASGDPKCPKCPTYAGEVGGAGIAYSVYSAVIAPYHPNCMCYSVPEVTDSPQAVTERLRAGLIDAENQYLKPFLTPVQTQAFIDMLMGWDTWQDLLAQTLVGQPQPRLF